MPLGSEESRREAMKLAVKVPGVLSAALDKDKGQVTVIGEDVDPVAVVKMLKERGKLRKLLGCLSSHHVVGPIDLVTVEDVKEEKKEEKKPEEKKPEAWPAWTGHPNCYGGPPVMYVVEGSQSGGCFW